MKGDVCLWSYRVSFVRGGGMVGLPAQGEGADVTEGFDHMIFYRGGGYGEPVGDLFVGVSMDAAKDEDLLTDGRKAAGQGQQVIGIFEGLVRFGRLRFFLQAGGFGQAQRFFTLGVFPAQVVDQRTGCDVE